MREKGNKTALFVDDYRYQRTALFVQTLQWSQETAVCMSTQGTKAINYKSID